MLSPRGHFGLEAKILASASASRFRPRLGLDLVVLLCNRAFFVRKSCKIREFCKFFGNNLNHMLLIIIWYFFIIIFETGLGLDLIVLASASASRFWSRLTSLKRTRILALTDEKRQCSDYVPCGWLAYDLRSLRCLCLCGANITSHISFSVSSSRCGRPSFSDVTTASETPTRSRAHTSK